MMRSIIRDLGGKSSTSLRSAQNDTGAPPAISTVGEDTILPKNQNIAKGKADERCSSLRMARARRFAFGWVMLAVAFFVLLLM